MNPDLAFEILNLALSLLKARDAAVAETLLKIIQGAAQAYQQHTGEPLDLLRIKAEQPLSQPLTI
jgi:hypothetical protein